MVLEKASEEIGYNIFYDSSVLILGVYLKVYLQLQTARIVFFYIGGKNVFSTVQFTVPVFSVSSSHGTFEASKTKIGGVALDGPPLGFMIGPVGH